VELSGAPGVATVTRLLANLVRISPTALETWSICERRFLLRHVLGVPASDAGPPSDEGLRLHAVLRFVHVHGRCDDDAFVHETLVAHGCDTPTMRGHLERHRQRCPRDATRGRHEIERARYHHSPGPMFLATARIDAIWLHDGVFDVRDYKSGGLAPMALRDDVRAQVQAWVLAPRAAATGARLQVRYEYLAPEIDEDPDVWEPDDDDLAAVEERLRATVAAMHDSQFPGVDDAAVCSRCPWRSVCAQSAAPGEPTWPVLAFDGS
jgi:hypothetical protein